MGMDVSGRKPTSEEGEYFRNNVWYWHPLADYIAVVAPGLAAKVKHWHSNDGDGLRAKDAIALADILDEEVKSGRCKAYQISHEARLAALPRETCEICKGSGIRSDWPDQASRKLVEPLVKPDHPRYGQVGWCNGCDGRGDKKAWDANYPFSVENVEEFSKFSRHSGGFKIY